MFASWKSNLWITVSALIWQHHPSLSHSSLSLIQMILWVQKRAISLFPHNDFNSVSQFLLIKTLNLLPISKQTTFKMSKSEKWLSILFLYFNPFFTYKSSRLPVCSRQLLKIIVFQFGKCQKMSYQSNNHLLYWYFLTHQGNWGIAGGAFWYL